MNVRYYHNTGTIVFSILCSITYPNFSVHVPVSIKVPCLGMVFILEQACTAGMFKETNIAKLFQQSNIAKLFWQSRISLKGWRLVY